MHRSTHMRVPRPLLCTPGSLDGPKRSSPSFWVGLWMMVIILCLPASPVLADNTSGMVKGTEAALCQGRSPCFIAKTEDGGSSSRGETLQVVFVVLAKAGSAWDQASYGDGCIPYEVWLTRSRETVLTSWQLLTERCNDGYGASGMGEDQFFVDKGILNYRQLGGSAWRWDRSVEVQLSPVVVLSDSSDGYWAVGPNSGKSTVQWSPFKVSHEWYSPACGSAAAEGDQTFEPDDKEYNYDVSIPLVSMPESFVKDGWRALELGNCGLRVDASGKNGFLIHGQATSATDAAFTVVAIDKKTLLVEVTDDRWVHSAKTWLFEDHLEIWRGPAFSYHDHCVPPKQDTEQWAIRVHDGQVFPAHGKPSTPIKVQRVHTPSGSIRLKLTLPFDLSDQAITVVYSDSDDGKTQKTLIANSRLQFGKARTFGSLYSIDEKTAICDGSTGRLDLKFVRQYLPTEPVISGP